MIKTHHCRNCSVELGDDNWRHFMRRAGDYQCSQCRYTAQKAWAQSNTELVNRKNREWRAENKEKFLSIVQDWKARHPEKVAEYAAKSNAKRRAMRQEAAQARAAIAVPQCRQCQGELTPGGNWHGNFAMRDNRICKPCYADMRKDGERFCSHCDAPIQSVPGRSKQHPHCTPCKGIYAKKNRQAARARDEEGFKAKARAKQARNRDRINAANRAWRAANPEKFLASVKSWNARHPEQRAALNAKSNERARLKRHAAKESMTVDKEYTLGAGQVPAAKTYAYEFVLKHWPGPPFDMWCAAQAWAGEARTGNRSGTVVMWGDGKVIRYTGIYWFGEFDDADDAARFENQWSEYLAQIAS